MRFSEIIGQSENVRHLQHAITRGKVSHAYMLCGEEGSGRMPLAMAFAAALLCEQGGDEACMQCPSCHRIAENMHPDLHRVSHEKPNTITVEDVRTQVIHDIGNRPYGGYKVYIIDEAEKMNEAAQNALLKTIEEPPSYAVLLLLVTNAGSLLPTIRSRCVQLTMRPVPDAEIVRWLMEREGLPDYRARSVAAFAQNNLGRAVRLATSPEFAEQKERIARIMRGLPDSTHGDRIAWQKELSEHKEQLPTYFSLMQVWIRDLLLIKATGKADRAAFLEEQTSLRKTAERVSYRQLQESLLALEDARRQWTANVRPELLCGLLLERMAGN